MICRKRILIVLIYSFKLLMIEYNKIKGIINSISGFLTRVFNIFFNRVFFRVTFIMYGE